MKTIGTCIATVWLALLLAAAAIPQGAFSPTAADELTAFDARSVTQDLQNVDLGGYPADPEGEVKLIKEHGLIEYAFSTDPAIAEPYYGVYLYVYNPAGLTFSVKSGAAFANVAISYDDEGKPKDYATRELVLLSQTKDKRFLKLKFKDSAEFYSREIAYSGMHEGARRYDIADVNLTELGASLPRAFEIGASFTATGFSKGCANNNPSSTLKISSTDLAVIPLEVHPTQYLTGADTAGENKQYMLSSVYFSVPQTYMRDYGALTFIKAEWYEYRTTPIIVTDSEKIFSQISEYTGYTLRPDKTGSIEDSDVPFYLVNDRRPGDSRQFGWDYNRNCDRCEREIKRLDWVFRVNDLTDTIPRAALQSYAENYTGKSGVEITIGEKKINSSLFDPAVEEGHTRGYNETVIDLRNRDDFYDLKLKNTTSSWQRFLNLFRSEDKQYETFLTQQDIPPIYPVNPEETVDKSAISNTLLVSNEPNEIDSFANFVQNESKAGNQTFLFRFSVNEYETRELEYGLHSSLLGTTTKCYGAIAPIFLNFKIIYLGFWDTRNETIIPVVQSPIDIYPNITPPPSVIEEASQRWIVWVAVAGGICLVGLIVSAIVEKEKL